jgi:hypothetical protein
LGLILRALAWAECGAGCAVNQLAKNAGPQKMNGVLGLSPLRMASAIQMPVGIDRFVIFMMDFTCALP